MGAELNKGAKLEKKIIAKKHMTIRNNSKHFCVIMLYTWVVII
jgi:hypothetical protein